MSEERDPLQIEDQPAGDEASAPSLPETLGTPWWVLAIIGGLALIACLSAAGIVFLGWRALSNQPGPLLGGSSEAEAAFDRAYAAAEAGDLETAIDEYTRVVELDPTYADAYYNRGLVYDDLGNWEAALVDFDRYVELVPEDPDGYESRAYVYIEMGDVDAALDDFSAIIALDPDNAGAYNNRAWFAALSDGDLDQALDDANRAVELAPVDYIYDTRGYVYYKRGNYVAALADYDEALDLGLSYSYYGRGLTYEAMGDTGQAIADYERFLEAYPDTPPESDDARDRLEALREQAAGARPLPHISLLVPISRKLVPYSMTAQQELASGTSGFGTMKLIACRQQVLLRG